MAIKMEFTPLFMYPAHQEIVMAEAKWVATNKSNTWAITDTNDRGVMKEGDERVEELMLDGDPCLFRHGAWDTLRRTPPFITSQNWYRYELGTVNTPKQSV